MRQIASFLLSVCMILGLCACGQKADVKVPSNEPSWQEQYDLGIRYLSEGNYEEAIIAFTAAIEIDPKNVTAYISLSDAYMAQGDAVAAKKVLEDALLVFGTDASIQARLTEIKNTPHGEFAAYYTSNLVRLEELTINGIPFWQATLKDAQLAYPNGDIGLTWAKSPEYRASYYDADGGSYGCCYIGYNEADERLRSVVYASYLDRNVAGFSTELRDLCCGQDLQTVLRNLGFTNDAAETLSEWNSTYIGIISGSVSAFESWGECSGGKTLSIHFPLDEYSGEYSVMLDLFFDTNNILSRISYGCVD